MGDGQPLDRPIIASKVESAMKLLQNGRAPSPNGVSNELLKYATGILSEPFAEIINAILEQHIPLEALGKSILVALFYPGNPLGPLTSLRPSVHLNSVRKIVLSSLCNASAPR